MNNNNLDDLISRIDFERFYSERIQIKGKPGTEIVGLCPFHEDKQSSFAVNATTGLWKCFACHTDGNIFQFVEKLEGVTFKEAVNIVARFVGVPSPIHNSIKDSKEEARPLIKSSLPKKYLDDLLKAQKVLDWVQEKKGLSLKTIKKYNIGWNGTRNTIPIYDEKGILRNIRLYNGKKDPKLLSYRNKKFTYGEGRIYGLDEIVQRPKDTVILCEGEFDKLITSQHGFLAVTGTTGAGTFKPEWKDYFKKRQVVIIYDMDPEGRHGAENVARALTGVASSVKNVELPVKGSKDDKDISDYFLKHGASIKDLKELIQATPIFKIELELLEEKTPKALRSFVQVDSTKNIDLRVKVPLSVSGETSEAFHGIYKFKVDYCQWLELGKCNMCPRDRVFTITPGEKEFIESCMSSETQVIGFLRHRICPYGQKAHIEILEKLTVREFFATQRTKRFFSQVGTVGIDERGSELVERKVYLVSDETVKPQSYFATGYIRTHPKTQQVCLLATELEPIEEEFESFVLNDEAKNNLKQIQELGPKELIDILSEEVLYLKNRQELILAIFLTYCSPLRIHFNQIDIRGWINTIILGDSGTGKCITGDSLLFTNQGIKRIDKIGKFENDKFLPSPDGLEVFGLRYFHKPKYTYKTSTQKTIKISSALGYQLEGTFNHPVMILEDNLPVFRKLEDLKLNDLVAIQYNQNYFTKPKDSKTIEVPDYFGAIQEFSLKDFQKISRFIGYLIGDGSFCGVTRRDENQIGFTNGNKEIINDYCKIISEVFDINPNPIKDKRSKAISVRFQSSDVRDWLLDFGLLRVKSEYKEIPKGILELDKANIRELLRGLFETDGYIQKRDGVIGFSSASQKLIDQLKILLLNFGIMSKTQQKWNKTYRRYYSDLILYGINSQIFLEKIGFVSIRKQTKAQKIKRIVNQEYLNWDLSKEFDLLWQKYKKLHPEIRCRNPKVKILSINTIRQIRYGKHHPSRDILKRFLELTKELEYEQAYRRLSVLLNWPVYWDRITKIELSKNETYDLSIPNNHTFFANGFINHNTSCISRLADYVGIGDIVSGLTSSRTGITYGLSEHAQKGWMIKIGRYPANSRKIVCIDEIQYIKERDIRTLGKAMDEGFLTIDRIAEKTLESMTRLLALANPRGDKVMDEHMFGCEGLRDLFDKPIIRRFDLALCLTSGDIESKELNLPNIKISSEKIPSKMLRDLIFWVWTRPSELISISEKATDEILKWSITLTDVFGDATEVPLVSPGDFSNKLARIATAYAGLCVSTDSKFEKIIVQPKHVKTSAKMIEYLYSAEGFGLKEFSEITKLRTQLTDYDEIKEAIEKSKKNEAHGSDLIPGEKSRIEKLLYAFKMHDEMRRRELADFIDAEENVVKRKIQILSKFNLIDSGPRGYFKKPKFIKFLRRLARDENTTIQIQ